MTSKYSVVIEKDEKWYVAHCVELGIASQGKSIEEAKINIKEAIELYLESFSYDKDFIFNNDKIFTTVEIGIPTNV